MNKKLALGIDVGGTNSVFGLTDQHGNIFFEESISTEDCSTPEDLVEKIYQRIKDIGQVNNILGIGIGAPNGNFFSGTIEFAPNLPWKGIIPLARLFEFRFKVDAILTNDANAAAIGEMIYGAAKDLKDFVTITLGTGLGSGIIVDGKLVYGHDGFAGEYGHIRVVNDGRSCGCGRKGCLETYASATGVVRSIEELESEHKSNSKIVSMSNPNAQDVFRVAQEGDKFCKEIIEFTAEKLGSSLADFACFSSPKAFVLFGGIAQSGEVFAKMVKKYMEASMLKIYQDKVEIRVSELHDKNAAVLGASSLVWNQKG
ncbi:MAG: ROK family protein [Crocinitomicaceae bacterium]|nr:ROK family protein [Crocinitomicaceae bacterium]